MFALLACSLLSLTLILERVYFWWKLYHSRSPEALKRALELLRQSQWQGALDFLSAKVKEGGAGTDPVLRVMLKSLPHRGQDLPEVLQLAASQELAQMRRYQTGLDTVIMVAPLLGILGTVIGIIGAFDLFSHTGLNDVQVVTGGIAEALITTATGLVIAILTVIPSQLFQSRLVREKGRMEEFLTEFEVSLRQSSQGGSGGESL